MGHFGSSHFHAYHFGAWAFAGGSGIIVPFPPYRLKWWQERKFKERCDLWKPTKFPESTTFVKAYMDVPCYLERMPSASQVERFGRTEQDDLFTRDEWWFHERQEIGDGWAIAMKAIDRNGNPHPEYRKIWICQGDPRINIDDIGDEGHIEIVSDAQPEPPLGVEP